MKHRVDKDDVCVRTVDAGGKNNIKPEAANGGIPGTAEAVEQKPENKADEMGPRYRRNTVPNQPARAAGCHVQIRDPLGI